MQRTNYKQLFDEEASTEKKNVDDEAKKAVEAFSLLMKNVESEYSKDNPDIKELEFKFKTRKTDLNARQMGLCHLKRDCEDFVEMYKQLVNQMNIFKVHRAM